MARALRIRRALRAAGPSRANRRSAEPSVRSFLVTMHLQPVVAVTLAIAPLVAASFFAYRHLVFE
jgi:hypothetical protein